MKLLYMGTPVVSADCLRRLAREPWPIVGVITQPDRPKGRSRTPKPSPVKEAASELGLVVHQPEKASAPEFLDVVRALAPDITVVFAFGEIVTQAFLDLASISTINLHLSLLPKYRGAAPVQWAIANGETETGISVMYLVKKMDAGASLEARLAGIGAELVVEAIRALESGTAPRIPQNHDEATFAPKLKKEDGLIDWTQPAEAIERRVRAFIPWPTAYTFLPASGGARMLRVLEARVVDGDAVPGKLLVERRTFRVGTGHGLLEVARIQPEGKRPMTTAEFLAGHRVEPGTTLGGPAEEA